MTLKQGKKLSSTEKKILFRTFSENSSELPKSKLINEYISSTDPINLLRFRREYYTRYSFPILTHEFMVDVKEKINPKSVVDLGCGPGWLSFWLIRYELHVKDSIDLVNGGGFENMKFSKSKINIVKMDIIDYLTKYNNKDDLLLLSWPPYESSLARRVFETIEENQLLMYIGEGMGGCTADDEFHELIEDKVLETNFALDSFWSIHDDCFLIKK